MSDISKRVMRRVYFIWSVRQLASPLFLKVAVFSLLVWQVKEAVFVREVFANMAYYKPAELFNFWSAAFLNTDFIVQIAIMGIGALAILFARDIIATREPSVAFANNG